jgi:hypothetical protein
MKNNFVLHTITQLFSLIFLVALCVSSSKANVDNAYVERGYKVIYSVFNSKFLTPEISAQYGLKRNDDLTLLNIVVTKDGQEVQTLGMPADIEGSARNLLQQNQQLEFLTVNEGSTVYYIAPIKHLNQEVYNFDLKVIPEGETKPLRIQFSKKLYSDR